MSSVDAEVTAQTIQARLFKLQKAGNNDREYEDAAAEDLGNRRFAITDGATDSYDSGRWADLLARKFVEAPPSMEPAALATWVRVLASCWRNTVNLPALPWNQAEKARLGAHCTFLGLDLALNNMSAAQDNSTTPIGSWRAMAVGDTCLFHVRNDALLTAFPLDDAGLFNSMPALLATNPEYRGPSADAAGYRDGELQLGDVLLLATDALAQWILRIHAKGERPWQTLLTLSQEGFTAFIEDLRTNRLIRNDDVTLYVITVGGTPFSETSTEAIILASDMATTQTWSIAQDQQGRTENRSPEPAPTTATPLPGTECRLPLSRLERLPARAVTKPRRRHLAG